MDKKYKLNPDAADLLARLTVKGNPKLAMRALFALKLVYDWSEEDFDRAFLMVGERAFELAEEALSAGETSDVGKEKAWEALQKHKERVAAYD